ncbi:hypothetical protein [Parafrankia sp. BMG5.11]|uniref:hypothetical protein n=1 Tax=Parafrankia sp. BMG5.11 TaxID=222540 RepID=UPI00103E7CC7|nr:hypothetical protein [Parafrankia sp. BMG5.11]TCJ37784.1 hypothetical protein E0504_17090 [Parafrankia sp. BMG5.11]
MGRRREKSGGTSRRWRLGLLGGGAAAAMVAVLVVVLLVVVGGSEEQPEPPEGIPQTTIAPSMSSGLTWPSGANANPPQDIRTWETWIGRPTDVAVVFTARRNWQTITQDDWPISDFRPNVYQGMLSVAQPLFPEDGNEAACARGEYNQQWAAFGQTLVRNSRPDAIVRPGWEFNGKWFWWY